MGIDRNERGAGALGRRSGLVVNDQKLVAALRRLDAKVLDRNVLRRTLRRAGIPIRNEAKRLVPVKSGDLRDSIKVRVSVRRRTFGCGLVGARVPYAHLVEFGTEPHFIAYKGRMRERTGARGFRHPGAKPKPYLRPAFDTKTDEAVSEARKVLREAVLKAVKGAL